MFKKIFGILFISFWMNHCVIAMEEGTSSGNKRKTRLKFDFKKDKKPKVSKTTLKVQPVKESKEEVAEPNEKYELSYQQAPPRIKSFIHAHLSGKKYVSKLKNLLLVGKPGTGKTTLAMAIAYKLGREAKFIAAPNLLAHFRDQAAENLRTLFLDELAKDFENGKNPVLILDEINVLTDEYNSEHSDKKDTAAALWTLIDQFQEQYENFLLIGTTNISKKMPHQLQSRFKGKAIIINRPSAEAFKQSMKLLHKELGVKADTSFNDAYITNLLTRVTLRPPSPTQANNTQVAPLNIEEFREMEMLTTLAIWLFDTANTDAPEILVTVECTEQALRELQQENQLLWDSEDPETAEDRRHREMLQQSAAQFQENKELQIKTAELNAIVQGAVAAATQPANSMTNFAKKKIAYAAQQAFSLIFPQRPARLQPPVDDDTCTIM